MRTSVLSLALAAVLLAGCSKDQPQPLTDAGPPPPAPTVTSITPASGPKAGNTVVSVLGTGFQSGAKLFIGSVEATQVTVVSDLRLTGTTPVNPVNGPVDVKVVNPDGQSGVLAQGFRVIPPPSDRTEVDSCQLLSPQSFYVGEGSISITPVVGTVTAIGVTDVPGQGASITGEVGYGPSDAGSDTSAWTWVVANYDDGRSGTTYDAYSSSIVGPTRGDYRYAFRFQYDGGAWTYCDLNGSDVGGFTADQFGTMTVGGPQVDWCNLQWPSIASSVAGQPATLVDGGVIDQLSDGGQDPTVPPGSIFSHVWKNGVTDDAGQGPGIWSQMGVGPLDAGPASSSWAWVDATWNSTCTSCNNGHDDEYRAQLIGPQYGGTYLYGFRYKVDGGDWVYCNQTGIIAGDVTTGLGVLTNTGPQPLSPNVDWCTLEQSTTTAQTGQTTPAITSQVYKGGVTDTAGNGALLTAQLGYGPTNTDPTSSNWTWTGAQFSQSGLNFPSGSGNNYRYSATTTAPATGNYAYAYRYQYNGGPYTYCDTAGVWDAGTSNLGALTVTPPPNGNVQCALESLSAGAVNSGSPLTAVAHVYVASVTPGTGQGAGVIAQAGVGAWNSSPQSGWGWQNAAYLDDSDGGATDRYTALLTPAYTGDRSVTFRVSIDDGGSWNYCDATQIPDAGYLLVNPADTTATQGGVGWCNLQWPPNADGGTMTYGRAWAPSITSASVGADAGLVTAQLGYGPSSNDPGVGTAWTWLNATFSTSTDAGCSNCGDNYEYKVALPPADAGLSYAYRFTVDGGAWCFGDTGGSSDGFSGSQLGVITP